MKSLKFALLFGALLWLGPFLAAMLFFPFRESNRALFESLMPVVIALLLVIFTNLYFRKVKGDYLKEGIWLGIIWMAISLLIDFPMFSGGPMKMGLAEYVSDVGLTYLMIPIITVGTGYLLEKKTK